VLTFLFLISCKDKECYAKYKDYNGSLIYLKGYFESDDSKTYQLEEVSQNINVLEKTSGINLEAGGEFIGKYRVTQNDLDNWEKWLIDKCEGSR